jgi:hypothetical protein
MSNGETTNGNGTAAAYKMGGRKFALVVFVFVVTTALLVSTVNNTHFINESTWLTVTLGVIGSYIAGNVVQGALNR